MDKKTIMMFVVGGIVIVLFSLINYFYLSKIIPYSSILYIAIIFIVSIPIFVIKYREQQRVKELEEAFPLFLRDFVEGVRCGMTIPQAFKAISNNDYRILTPYVKKISAQLDWGIPLEKVLMKFAQESKSRLIGRIISSVIEAHRFGGNLANTFEALSKTALEVERLRAERRLYMNSQMITGYIIFFVFLGVMIALGKFLVPTMGQVGLSGTTTVTKSPAETAAEYKQMFLTLILIQGFFAGLIVGKMAEGAMVSGIRHSFIMMIIGAAVFLMFG
jgi:archaeal flagellar protein FlaJ